jgi:hypothetical protein
MGNPSQHPRSGTLQRVTESRTREAWSSTIGVVVLLVRLAGAVAAVILVAHVVLTLGSANPANGITRFVRTWADALALGFRDLFTPADVKIRTLVNYGLAALIYLVVTAIAARLIRRLG